MHKSIIIAIAILWLLCPSGFCAVDLEDQISLMQDQIAQLQKLVSQQQEQLKAQDKEIRHLREVVAEQGSTIPEQRKEATPLNTLPRTIDNVSIGGGLTGVIQGTSGNDENVKQDGEVTDGSWSGDLELEAALGKKGTAFMLIEAGDGEGLQDDEVRAYHGVNDDSNNTGSALEVTEAWYEHTFVDNRFVLTAGKIDVTNYFDTNEVANDETTQFLSSGLVNSLAVEWPDDNGLGVRATLSPSELFDLSLGWAEADADWEDSLEDSFAIAELGFKPTIGEDLQGNYRFYGWYNGNDKVELNGSSDDEAGFGFGLSADQQVCSMATLFARIGWQNEDVYEIEWAWSMGAELTMDMIARPEDVLAIAYGQAHTNEVLDLEDERHLEMYYRIQLTDYFAISPNFQYFWDPEGNENADDFAVFGARTQLSF